MGKKKTHHKVDLDYETRSESITNKPTDDAKSPNNVTKDIKKTTDKVKKGKKRKLVLQEEISEDKAPGNKKEKVLENESIENAESGLVNVHKKRKAEHNSKKKKKHKSKDGETESHNDRKSDNDSNDQEPRKIKRVKTVHDANNITAENTKNESEPDQPSGNKMDDDEMPNDIKRKKVKKEKKRVDNLSTESVNLKSKKKKKNKKKKEKTKIDREDQSSDEGNEKQAEKSAVEYLMQWVTDRSNWKFQKVRQIWLLHNMYDENKITDADFVNLKLYLEGLKGKSRETTTKEAEKVIEEEDEEAEGYSPVKSNRAKEIVQLLS